MEGFPMLWMLATACLIGFFASYYLGALGLVLLAFLALFGALLIGLDSFSFWNNIGQALLVSAALQLSYLLGLLSEMTRKRVGAVIRAKEERAREAVAEASLSK